MFRCVCQLLKKKEPPLGLDRRTFFKKLRNPRASKPWRDRRASSAGRIEVTLNTDVVGSNGQLALGSLTGAGPLGTRDAHRRPQPAETMTSLVGTSDKSVAGGAWPPDVVTHDTFKGHSLTASLPSGATSDASTAATRTDMTPCLFAADTQDHAPGVADTLTTQSPPMTVLPIGQSLELNVESVRTYEEGPVPIHLQHLKRTKKEAAESIQLPRHLNKLFHQIMGWSSELVEIERDEAKAAETAPDPSSPALLHRQMHNLSDKMKYGVLLDSYEKDKFALEHRLQLAGDKLERRFLEWDGVHVLDQNPGEEMAGVVANKASIVIDSAASFRIPVLNHDCCPGCGALLQDRDEDSFGYVTQNEVARYVLHREQKLRARNEYATRMAELQAHWAKHGRRVGEEWLDFMTQEEFDAFYRDTAAPFVCQRCHHLERAGSQGRRKVWSAPDFTAQLRALRERRCVVVLVVDVTDFPGSMVYDLPGLISVNNDVIIAVNKMDCVRPRSFQYDGKNRAIAARLVSPRYVVNWVTDIAAQFRLPRRQIRAVVPLSAKRGWNVDRLLAAIEAAANLNLSRPGKPLPTYFVGVTNVGKSSVINAIAHHLYIPQPPHPKSKKVYYTKSDASGRQVVLWRWYTPPNVNQAEMRDIPARHDKRASKLLTVSSLPGTTVAVNAVRIALTGAAAQGREAAQSYLYDTPGLLPHWHRDSPLTLLQMRRTLIRRYRNPQCFILLAGHTLFLGGMAALDVVKGPPRGLLLLVYTSHKVRNAIVSTDRSDAFWQEQLGKALDPPGSLEQLLSSSEATAPALQESKSYYFECFGRHRRRPKADIYVCGLGWVSFCVSEPADVVLRVRTISGAIHGVREPLRYNDLRAFRHWPKLRRRFTSRGIEDLEHDVDTDSVGTVVQLTATSTDDAAHAAKTKAQADIQSLHPVPKASHPHSKVAAMTPFNELAKELQISGIA